MYTAWVYCILRSTCVSVVLCLHVDGRLYVCIVVAAHCCVHYLVCRLVAVIPWQDNKVGASSYAYMCQIYCGTSVTMEGTYIAQGQCAHAGCLGHADLCLFSAHKKASKALSVYYCLVAGLMCCMHTCQCGYTIVTMCTEHSTFELLQATTTAVQV